MSGCMRYSTVLNARLASVDRSSPQHGARHIVLTSRSGVRSLERARSVLALRMLAYLKNLPDLDLLLLASDGASASDLQDKLSALEHPIAGCMLLAVCLSDGNFLSQNASGFDAVFEPKLGAFEAFDTAFDIDSLDFLIVFSSISTFGNAGQTNYSRYGSIYRGCCCASLTHTS